MNSHFTYLVNVLRTQYQLHLIQQKLKRLQLSDESLTSQSTHSKLFRGVFSANLRYWQTKPTTTKINKHNNMVPALSPEKKFPWLFHDLQGPFSMTVQHCATVRHFLLIHFCVSRGSVGTKVRWGGKRNHIFKRIISGIFLQKNY